MLNRPTLNLVCVDGRLVAPELTLRDAGLRCALRCPHHVPRPADQGGVLCRLDGQPLVYRDGYVARCFTAPS